MIPFQVRIEPGEPVYCQVVYAVKRALAQGRLKPGQRFPSVRVLSQELRVNPNTIQRVVAELCREGVLAIRAGQGSYIRGDFKPGREEVAGLLEKNIEHLVVEARRMGISLKELNQQVEQQWNRLSKESS